MNAAAPLINPAGEKIRFTDLEPLICDAANMVDVLLENCETHFAKSDDASIIITATEANRVFFIASQAELLVGKVKKAYYEAWDNERGEGGLPIAGQLGTLIAAHVVALAAYDATPGDDPKSPAVARANALVTKTRQALFDHRPTNMAEAARKGEFMASCRTFIEWDDFDQVQLINALTPKERP
ncbi:hypothetical protein JQK88_29825 [Mesorhizobium caraganae]|uniref:hypothetical protein n=1 Tax=Mesorhizobium caraganae TaxID=483206 RepID=UPI00193A9A51|nr:hypothetical protein [Mesorhizobium caraganae]MBM2715333.1 hypothetical protein [Mesorhizobium caraganae]